MTNKASSTQVGGNHYRTFAIQPSEFCQRNGLNWCESNAIKYVARHRSKNGVEDIDKAIHYLNLLKEWEYPNHSESAPSENAPGYPYDSTGPAIKLCGCGVKGKESHLAMDLRLPSYALPVEMGSMRNKAAEEYREWQATEPGSLHELMESWDMRQVAQTWMEREPCEAAEYFMEEANERLLSYRRKGRDVMSAKHEVLAKNAQRGYYEPVVNLEIAAGVWRP